MDRLDKAVSDHRKYNNKNLDIRWLGDGGVSSDPRVRDNSGRMWTRKQTSGGWGLPVALALDTNANVPPHAGIPVEVGYDIKGEQCILRVYREGLVQSGTTPAITNPSDAQVQEAAPIPDIKQFLCKRSADSAKPWAVVVLDGYIEIDSISRVFNQAEVDFDTLALVPVAGSKCIACIFLKNDLTLEVFASTPVLPTDPILVSHINECRQQAAIDSMSIWGWVLDGDASGLSEEIEKNIDLRPKFQPPPPPSTLPAFGTGVIKTLASGVAATGTDRHVILAAETGTADDCIEITGLTIGDEVIVRADAGDTITMKHNDAGATVKTLLYNAADIALSGDKTLKLVLTDTNKLVQCVDEKGTGTGGATTTAVYASRPAAGNDGNLFFPSDGVDIQRDNGAAWQGWGPQYLLTDPPSSSWSWDNQTTSTEAASNNKRYMKAVGTAGAGVTLSYRTMPTAPYVLTVGMVGMANNSAGSSGPALFVRASDGKLIEFRYTFGSALGLHKWTDSVTYSAAYKNVTGAQYIIAPMVWLRIEDDNTNLIFSVSADGQNFLAFYTVARTDFLTPAQVGWGTEVSSTSGTDYGITLLSWLEA